MSTLVGAKTLSGFCYWDPSGIASLASGIHHYAENLRRSLLALGCPPKVAPVGSGWTNRIKIWQGQQHYNLARAALVQKDSKILYHGLANLNVPLWQRHRGDRFVVTVHDLIPLLAPHAVSWSYSQEFRFGLPRALKVADRVVAVSHWTAQHLKERYPWSAHKIVVMLHGLDGLPTVRRLREEKLDKTILLTVSRFETYKRFPLLLALLRSLDDDFILRVVTDRRGVKFLHQQADDLLAQERLQVYSSVSAEELASLYQDASLVVLPSWYEGFCLPAAEALAARVPLVYQRGNAIEEFVSAGLGQGIAERSDDVAPWVESILAFREYKHSPQFMKNLRAYTENRRSWSQVGAEMLHVYEDLWNG